MNTRAPVMYIGHGSPMFAVDAGHPGRLLSQYSQHLEGVKAVLVISPHWMTRGLQVTAALELETIHDFGGFPAALYKLHYGAPGAPDVAEQVASYLDEKGYRVELNPIRGRDHGAWVPMLHLLPEQRVPVLQLSLDATMDGDSLVALGEVLSSLRDEGIAIVASGSLTHNLYEMRHPQAGPAAYVERFQGWVRERVQQHATRDLIDAQKLNSDFSRAHPTAEHYLPLLIALGARRPEDQLTVLDGGIQYGTISMESYGWH